MAENPLGSGFGDLVGSPNGIYIIKTDRAPTQFGCKKYAKERKTL
jgi:hypothetical protein